MLIFWGVELTSFTSLVLVNTILEPPTPLPFSCFFVTFCAKGWLSKLEQKFSTVILFLELRHRTFCVSRQSHCKILYITLVICLPLLPILVLHLHSFNYLQIEVTKPRTLLLGDTFINFVLVSNSNSC